MKIYTLQYVTGGKRQNKNVLECRPGLVSTSAPRQESCTKAYPRKTRAVCIFNLTFSQHTKKSIPSALLPPPRHFYPNPSPVRRSGLGIFLKRIYDFTATASMYPRSHPNNP